jgi:hypothetical protein
MNAQAAKDAEEAAKDEAEEDAEHGETKCCGCGMNANARNAVFHVIMSLASCYLAMLLTNWATYDTTAVAGVGTTSMWIKFVCQWVTFGLFLWTLIAPLCCPDRTFE